MPTGANIKEERLSGAAPCRHRSGRAGRRQRPTSRAQEKVRAQDSPQPCSLGPAEPALRGEPLAAFLKPMCRPTQRIELVQRRDGLAAGESHKTNSSCKKQGRVAWKSSRTKISKSCLETAVEISRCGESACHIAERVGSVLSTQTGPQSRALAV
jgi:hypothetical protein